MSLALHYWMRDVHHCSGPPPVSEMTYTVSSGRLPYHAPLILLLHLFLNCASFWDRPKLSMPFLTTTSRRKLSMINYCWLFARSCLVWCRRVFWCTLVVVLRTSSTATCRTPRACTSDCHAVLAHRHWICSHPHTSLSVWSSVVIRWIVWMLTPWFEQSLKFPGLSGILVCFKDFPADGNS